MTKARAGLLGGFLAVLAVITGCSSNSDVASENLSKAADNFEVPRRIVFYNGITDQYALEIQGKCSINDQGNQLEVTCKTGPDEYKKHFLGRSNNMTYFVEQLEGVNVSDDFYRVNFKPSTIIPNIQPN